MKLLKSFCIRFLIISIPLAGLYFFAQTAFENNRKSEHPTDVGLGVAILFAFILIILFGGFFIDLIVKITKKQYDVAFLNTLFLLLFSLPILYISCRMSSYCESCFCSWIIDVFKDLI